MPCFDAGPVLLRGAVNDESGKLQEFFRPPGVDGTPAVPFS